MSPQWGLEEFFFYFAISPFAISLSISGTTFYRGQAASSFQGS